MSPRCDLVQQEVAAAEGSERETYLRESVASPLETGVSTGIDSPIGKPVFGCLRASDIVSSMPPVVLSLKNKKTVIPLTAGVGVAAEVTPGARWVEAVTYRFDCLKDAQNYCSALERQLRLLGLRDVLVDGRMHERQVREATEAIWCWVDNCSFLERMALINESENLALAIRMRSLASPKKKVRPFHSKMEAERWLLSGGTADGR